jgi:hypothetical protein
MLVRLSHATLSFLDMLHLEFERSQSPFLSADMEKLSTLCRWFGANSTV